MGERVTVSYRGAAYELGRGKRCYGIWAAGEPRSEPVERWPETPEGWVAAWTRFTAMETPGTIAPVGQHQIPSQSGSSAFPGPGEGGDTLAFGRQTQTQTQTPTPGRMALGSAGAAFSTALLALGVLFGVVGLFPHYQVGQSLASQPAQLIPHVAYLAVWTLAGLLVALRVGAVARAGALLAVGTSVVTFGLFLVDLGAGFSAANAGLWISLVGWLACTAGAALAFLITVSKGAFGRPDRRGITRAALLIAAAVGVALTFFPNWDSYLGRASKTGQSEVLGLGYAFANTSPGWVQAADVLIMVLFVLVVVVAALWRPLAAGAMLLAGAVIPMGAQAISALVQSSEPTSPLIFGLSASQAQTLGLTITNGLTPAFWLYCLCVLVLLVSCAWMLISPPDRAAAGSVPVTDAGPVTDSAEEPETSGPETSGPETSGPDAGPSVAPMHDTWIGPELAADSRDDRA